MLRNIIPWSKDPETELEIGELEYRGVDFYGPFVKMKIEKNGSMKVYPYALNIETAECTESDFSILCKISKEIFKEYGEFTLCVPLFQVEITSENTEEAINEEIIKMRMF